MDEKKIEGRPIERSKQTAIIVVLAIAGLCSSIMFTLVIPIQSQLPDLLNTSRENSAWVVTATLLAAAVASPIAGRLGDMYGKRNVALLLVGLLIVGSIIAGSSPGVLGVIIGRTLQGPVAGIVPLGISMLRDFLDPNRLNSAIAFLSATLGVGGAIGLPASAMVAQYGDWRLLFLMSGAIGILVFVLILCVIPSTTRTDRSRFDYLGAVGMGFGLVCVLLVISRGNEWGWTSTPVVLFSVAGISTLILWGIYVLKSSNPIVDLRSAKRRPILLTNIASLALGFSLFVSNITFPQILEIPQGAGPGLGVPLVMASLVVAPLGVMMMIVSPVAGRVAQKFGPRLLLISGSSALVVTYIYALFWHTEIWQILLANVLVGVGLGLSYASLPMLIMSSVEPADTGQANGLNALFRSLGTSVASAVVGAVLASNVIEQEGIWVPSGRGFEHAFIMGGVAALISVLFAAFLPSKKA